MVQITKRGSSRLQGAEADVIQSFVVDAHSLVSVTHLNILGEGQAGLTLNGDVIVIIESNQLAQLQVPSIRAGLVRDTLLEATITSNGVGVVVESLPPMEVGVPEPRGRRKYLQFTRLGAGWSDKLALPHPWCKMWTKSVSGRILIKFDVWSMEMAKSLYPPPCVG